VPFLDAKALDNDPDGMTFLRSVIRPKFEREEAALPRPRKDRGSFKTLSQGQAEPPKIPIRAEAARPVSVG
jgi:hypothetical protein